MSRHIWNIDRPALVAVAAALLVSPLALDFPGGAKLVLLVLAFGAVVAGGTLAAMMVVCLALPLSACTLQIGGTVWSPLELALLACGATAGPAALSEIVRARSLRSLRDWLEPLDSYFLAGALLLIATASIAWVADADLRSDSLRSLRRVVVEPIFVLPALADIRRRGTQRRLIPWLALSVVAVSVLAIGQLATGRSTVDIGGIERPIGAFTHPNNLAFYLERAIWFTPLAILSLARRFGRAAWILPGVVVVATLATFSRGAVVALAAGAVVLYWEDVRSRWRAFVGLAVAGAVAVFASRFLAESGDSVDTRTTIWEASIDMVRDRPVTGVGLDQFLGQYGRRYVRPEGWPERYTSHPHNIVLDFWLSLGIGGLAILWLLLEMVWRRARLALSTSGLTIERASVAMLAAGLVHGLIDNSFFLPELATFTWLGLGLASRIRVHGNG